MLNWNFVKNKKHIHFVGIGGVSMSAVAAYLLAEGFAVSGSDLSLNQQTLKLQKQGAKIFCGHDTQNAIGCDLLVSTSAVSTNNPEVRYAWDNNIPHLRREELLGIIFGRFGSRVAVCGMHGKTTTTALLTHILQQCDKSPTAFVGGVSHSLGGNLCMGQGDICVAEACEYRRSFLCLQPTLNCFLNIDRDHLDYYRDLADIEQAFFDFFKCTVAGGINLVNGDDPLMSCWKDCITFGFEQHNSFRAVEASQQSGMFSFYVMHEGRELAHISLNIPGRHNIYNALCAFCAAFLLGCKPQAIANAIYTFSGVERRFTLQKGKVCNFIVDYAHHPKEVECLISSVKLLEYNRILLAFQPHTYTRTKTLFDDFVAALGKADEVALLPTYAAREPLIEEYDSEMLAARFRLEGVNATFLPSFESLADYVQQQCGPRDVVLVAGAGDIFESEKLLT